MVSLHLCLCKYWFLVIFFCPYKKIYNCYLSKHFEQTHRVHRLIHYLVCISLSYSFFFITSFYTSFSFPILLITLLFYSSPYLYHVLVFYILPLPYLDASGFGDLHLWRDDRLFELFLQVELRAVPPTHVLHVGHSQVRLYVGHV